MIAYVVSPLHILDGCIHALTCVGPASKETSRHYWREPLVLALLHDAEVDFCAVVCIGSPQAYTDKVYVSQLLGTLIDTLDVDGVIVTTEGFGNNHGDFASHMAQIGQRGIPVGGDDVRGGAGAISGRESLYGCPGRPEQIPPGSRK